jgi:hypothetical protein
VGILTLQREAGQIGRIRLGSKVSGVSGSGKSYTRPGKLDNFRFTTHSEFAARAVAELLGGTPQPWKDAPSAGQWEVFTDRSEVNVIVPPGPKAVDSWYEMWQPAMCVRRCDGVTEQKTNHPCLCPSDVDARAAAAAKGNACRMTTRVNVMIPDLPGIGVWMLESHGFYAATEMTGVAEMLATAGANGVQIPARLRIEQRERRVYRGPDVAPETKKFPVPVLEVLATLREIAGAAANGQRAIGSSLPPETVPVRAAIAASVPAPAAIAATGAQSFMDRASAATSTPQLREIWKNASEAQVMDEFVTVPGSDVMEMLSEALQQRAADLEAGAAS